METLFAGVVLLALSIVLSLVVYKGARLTPAPLLMRDAWVANVHAPLILALAAFGGGLIVQFGLTAAF